MRLIDADVFISTLKRAKEYCKFTGGDSYSTGEIIDLINDEPTIEPRIGEIMAKFILLTRIKDGEVKGKVNVNYISAYYEYDGETFVVLENKEFFKVKETVAEIDDLLEQWE